MDSVVTGLIQGGMYAAFTLSLAILFSVMRVINFAHGDFMTVAFYGAVLLLGSGQSYAFTALALVGMLAALGVVLYYALFRPTQRSSDPALTQVFATVGLSLVIQNSLLLAFGGDTRRVPPFTSGSASLLGVQVAWSRVLPAVAVLVMCVGLWLLFHRSVIGTRLRAVAADRESAAISGIDVHRTFVLATVISFVILGVAAFTIAPNVVVFPLTGFNLLLVGFLAVVIGGLGSVFAAVGGAFALGLIEALVSTYGAPIFAPIGMYAAFLLLLLVRPRGIAGEAP